MTKIFGRVRARCAHILGAAFLCSLVLAAWSATPNTDNIKLRPSAVQSQASPRRPPEVQTLESQTAPAAFDRDTTSEHTAYDGGHLIAILETPVEIRAIKVYGAAPYTLSVE